MLSLASEERMIVMLTSLGKFLRTFRIQQGQLLKDMAERLDVVPAYLSSIENGKRNPTKKFINNIISSYELSGIEIDALNRAYSETLNEVSFNTADSTENQRDLCISFARKFNNLDNKQIDEIRKILEGIK